MVPSGESAANSDRARPASRANLTSLDYIALADGRVSFRWRDCRHHNGRAGHREKLELTNQTLVRVASGIGVHFALVSGQRRREPLPGEDRR
jgi:hypothetical protein